jgi:hypothetical protein
MPDRTIRELFQFIKMEHPEQNATQLLAAPVMRTDAPNLGGFTYGWGAMLMRSDLLSSHNFGDLFDNAVGGGNIILSDHNKIDSITSNSAQQVFSDGSNYIGSNPGVSLIALPSK